MVDPRKELQKRMNGGSREQLAQELGISLTQLSFVLTGVRRPSKALLEKLGLEVRVKREYVRATGTARDAGKDRGSSAGRGNGRRAGSVRS
jgi:transcriptional regulator with XRE-family HTH domain